VSRVYFTDRDLGKQFPRILAEAGIAVERHADIFPPDGSDEAWLEYCGKSGRVAISHNSRIRYVPNELAAVKRFAVPLFIVIGKVPTAELARNFVCTLPRIEAMLDERKPRLSRRSMDRRPPSLRDR
jgi:hypothetical protein